MKIQERISLKDFTTFRIGGPARFFVTVTTADDVTAAVAWAHERSLPLFVLGGGSNILFSDNGFEGLVIHTALTEQSIIGNRVTLGASVVLADAIEFSLSHGLIGMEFAAGIPGMVGGALRGNAGTFGKAMSDVVLTVSYVEQDSATGKTITHADCHFRYRHSCFKENNNIVTKTELQLTVGDVAASQKIINDRIAVRHQNHPLEPSAGCIFKNIELASIDEKALQARGIETDQFHKYMKVPTGYLIEQLGLKGKTIGGAQISSRHANYIINRGNATSDDVVTLISYVKQQIRDRYDIQLEEEINIVAER